MSDTRSAHGHVLITSASSKAPLIRAMQKAVAKARPGARVIAGDVCDQVSSRYVADDFWRMPATDPAALDALLGGAGERGITLILPTRDGELPFWAVNAERFAEAGIAIVISPLASIERCLDKLAFAAFGQKAGLPVIPAADHPDRLDADRFVVKERYGAGSRAIGLNLSREEALVHGAGLSFPLYQPFIRGDEISVDAWAGRDHRIKGVVLRHRDQVISGESRITTAFEDAKLEARMAALLQSLRLRGPVVLQAIVDARGQAQVIECNSRFGGASTLSLEVGLDSLYWSLLEAQGIDVTPLPFVRRHRALRQVRVASDIYVSDPGL